VSRMTLQLSARPQAGTVSSTPATLTLLKQAAKTCTNCDLYQRGTQTVFGEGPGHARIMLVGEQPGNEEDLAGQPFVGPAGRVLNQGLENAGIERAEAYVTNVVKHFKWEPRGKRRIHAKPNAVEIKACMPWLDSEIQLVRPKVVVCLGATAAQALISKTFRVTHDHGKVMPWSKGPAIMATVHPSSILRAADEQSRRAAMQGFTEDLRNLAEWLRL